MGEGRKEPVTGSQDTQGHRSPLLRGERRALAPMKYLLTLYPFDFSYQPPIYRRKLGPREVPIRPWSQADLGVNLNVTSKLATLSLGPTQLDTVCSSPSRAPT